ncbi:MAG TPA: hypothetical protein VIK91_24065 [Nannocystis sp.]
MRTFVLLGSALLLACSEGERASATGFATMPSAEGCIPGEQRACACPGGLPDGVQVCAPTGDRFEACQGCDGPLSTGTSDPTSSGTGDAGSASATSTGDDPGSTGDDPGTTAPGTTDPGTTGPLNPNDDPDDPCYQHCSNGIQDCGEPHTDCGADCPVGPEYTWCDCLIDTPRNGSEICDDTGFKVPADPQPGVLVCLEATGGQIYIATNTAIDIDNVPRCSGWENNGQNPWDHLEYIVGPLTCDAEQKTLPFDLTPWAGQDLWFGAHNHPEGGGSGTTACMAFAK